MTDLPIPRVHSSDVNYSTGPATGTPTKVDMGSALAAAGIIPGVAYLAQHENYERNALTRVARRALGLQLLKLRPTRVFDSATADTSGSIGVCQNGIHEALVAKGDTGGAQLYPEGSSEIRTAGNMAVITSDLRKVVNNGSRMLAVGDGGVDNAFSTNTGTSWTAGGATGLITPPTECVWNGLQFVISEDAGGSAHSTNGVAWTAATGGSDISDILTGGHGNGMAVFAGSSQFVIAAGAVTNPAFAISANNGLTWVNTGGTIASPGNYVAGRGWLAGNGGTEIYWLGNSSASDQLKLFVSSDGGGTWTLRSSLDSLNISSAETPKLLMCQETGTLVAVMLQTLAASAYAVCASYDKGVTWTAWLETAATSQHAFGIAGGRLFMAFGGRVYASDGIGRAGL